MYTKKPVKKMNVGGYMQPQMQNQQDKAAMQSQSSAMPQYAKGGLVKHCNAGASVKAHNLSKKGKK